MRLENKRWWSRQGLASIILESVIWGDHELVPNLEPLIREVTWLPNGVACGVSKPFLVGLRNIADVVKLFSRIFLVNILASA